MPEPYHRRHQSFPAASSVPTTIFTSTSELDQQNYVVKARDINPASTKEELPWGKKVGMRNTLTDHTGESSRSLGVRSGLSSSHLDNDDVDAQEEAHQAGIADSVLQKIQRHNLKHRTSVLSKLILRKGSGSTLDLSDMGISTLRESSLLEIQPRSVNKLTLARNEPLVAVPEALVRGEDRPLSSLVHLDLSKCQIVILPSAWDFPNMTTLDLSQNRIRDFPSKSMLKGLPLLRSLNLYGNRLMRLPSFGSGSASRSERRNTDRVGSNSNSGEQASGSVLHHLVWLNVGYNDLTYLPEQLPPRLRTLIVCNNFLAEIPLSLVQKTSSLKDIDVSSNPVAVPPQQVCEGGLRAMRKYYEMNPSCCEEKSQSTQRRRADSSSAQESPDRAKGLERIPSYKSRSRSRRQRPTPEAPIPEVVEFSLGPQSDQ